MNKRQALSIFTAFILSGCAQGDGKPMAQMTFEHLQPSPVYVASYEVVNNAKFYPSDLPDGFIANPEKVVLDYLGRRFASAGSQGKLIASLENISVRHEMRASENKVGEFLGVAKKDHYQIQTAVKIKALGIEGYDSREITLKAQRMLEVSEHVSLAEREKHQMTAIDNLIDDLDAAIQKVLAYDFRIMQPMYAVPR